ncbi:MAG: hypothetical protein HOM37_07290 [Acidimicrobiaceae bacterium]|jgi:acyl-CoA dehydrogenase|nr:hypothetical protein [Acidimicrobiaceae bacterium]
MIKVFATEMAGDVTDKAMQSFGAMGMTQELPLFLMSQRIRRSRIYEGPTEAHRMVVARQTLRSIRRSERRPALGLHVLIIHHFMGTNFS